MHWVWNWILGWVIWCALLVIYVVFCFYITGKIPQLHVKRKLISDDLFKYSRRPDFIPKDAFLLDTHSHTTGSDGWMTPKQLILWEIANGFNAFVLSDHNTGKNNPRILALQQEFPQITIIPGYEWTTLRIHMNLLGITEFEKPSSMNPSNAEIQQVIQKVHEKGGLIQVNHITWSQHQSYQKSGEITHPTRQQLLDWGIDGFEINNEMRWYDPESFYRIHNARIAQTLAKPIYLCTGTDIHNPLQEYATGWTEILTERNNATEDKSIPFTWQEIKAALQKGETRLWITHDYRVPDERKKTQSFWVKIKPYLLGHSYALQTGLEHHPAGIRGGFFTLAWMALSYFPIRTLMWLLTILFS